jgi:hypothetical protein
MNKVAKANTGPSILTFSTTASDNATVFSVTAPTRNTALAAAKALGQKSKAPDIESAVYAHIQAVRALGKTKITPEEIAAALGISISDVRGTIDALKTKGVKVLHGS